jgi:hypothetical protein
MISDMVSLSPVGGIRTISGPEFICWFRAVSGQQPIGSPQKKSRPALFGFLRVAFDVV